MANLKKKLRILLLLSILILPTLASSLTITNTTFSTSVSNYTIYVDSITLDNVTVTSTTIEFYNLTSLGSNLTNINETYDSIASFYGLDIGLTLRNINTSTDLFTSASGGQDYDAALPQGHLLRVMGFQTVVPCTALMRAALMIVLILLSLAILAVPIGVVYSKEDWFEDMDLKKIMVTFTAIIISISLIVAIAIGTNSVCG